MKKQGTVIFCMVVIICCVIVIIIGAIINNCTVALCGAIGFVGIIIGIIGGSYDETGKPLNISDLKTGSSIEVLSEGHCILKETGNKHVYLIELKNGDICAIRHSEGLDLGNHVVSKNGLKKIL